jgi:hypothetical protein
MLFMQPNNNFIKYCRVLPWTELTDEDEKKDVALIVIDSNIGYTVFRDGSYIELIDWFPELEDAIECAVERVQLEHARHEIQQEKGKDGTV